MRKELTIKQNDFWRLINREQFLTKYFNVRLRYRLPAINNDYIYIEVISDDKTVGEHAEQYILSYVEPKHKKSIDYPEEYKHILCDNQLLNRLMKEYLVHIEMEEKSHQLIFHSSTLTVLFLALDDFRKAITNVHVSNTSVLDDTQSILRSLSINFEREITTVDEQDRLNEQKIKKENNNDDEEEEEEEEGSQATAFRLRQEPKLKIAYPGAESNIREASLNELIVKGKKGHSHHDQKHARRQDTSDINDNDLVRELRQKLKGRNLRDVIIDGANIGRTYGASEFSARGIKLAVDLFHAYGYPDSKIVVIVPAHYLSKDKDHIFNDLVRRKILHQAFHQKIDDQNKRFYDDRLIVDLAVMRNGIILSNDFYRDLLKDSGVAVGKAIRERLLCYRFIGDNLCLPNPVSEGGLPLDVFLSM